MLTQIDKPTLRGARAILRDACDSDCDARFALGNVPEIHAMFGADPTQVREITHDAAKAWVRSVADDQHAWVIEADGKLLGAVRLHSVNHADKRATVAIGLLNPHELGKGYGPEALRLVARYAFDQMGLHRLTLRTLSHNDRAIAAFQKVGFVIEGRERESALIGDIWRDDLIMGLLPQDLVGAT